MKTSILSLFLLVGVGTNLFGQPTIPTQPQNQAASLFADATFRAIAAGEAPLSYHWRFNDTDWSGMTNSTLVITNVQRTNAGNYSVVVTNLFGSVTSQVAILTIAPFNALHCFGFSWTATRDSNFWTLPSYFPGHACNGPMWPELMSTNLGLAYIGTNNLARAGADSAQILNQVKQLKPRNDTALDLYVLWAGQSDFLYAASSFSYPTRTLAYIPWTNDVAWDAFIQTTLKNNSNAVEQLYAVGARSIMVQNSFDLSRFPSFIDELGTNQARVARLRERNSRFNAQLATALEVIGSGKLDLRLMVVDIQTRLDDLIDNFVADGFTKTHPSALDDSRLSDKSFTGPGKDYVFWDGLHPTSKTHSLIAGWQIDTLTNTVFENLLLQPGQSQLRLQASHLQIGRDYTLQVSPDIVHWRDFQAFTAGAGTNQLIMPSADTGNAYFRLTWRQGF